MVRFKLENVPDLRAAEAVDALVLITDDEEVAVSRSQRANQKVLRSVGVLVLIHQQMLAVRGVKLGGFGGSLEQVEGPQQEVVEIDGIGPVQRLLVQRKEPRRAPRLRRTRASFHLLGRLQRVLGATDSREDPASVVRRIAVVVLSEQPADQGNLIVAVVNIETGVEANGRPVAAQQTQT